jgi:hypothetical protein
MHHGRFTVLGDGHGSLFLHQLQLPCAVFSHSREQHTNGARAIRFRDRTKQTSDRWPESVLGLV